jgi:hypothetical protein
LEARPTHYEKSAELSSEAANLALMEEVKETRSRLGELNINPCFKRRIMKTKTPIHKLIQALSLLTLLAAQTASGFYDPNLQRWLALDPIGEAGGINLYQFVGNDPVNQADPDGLNPIVQRIVIPAANWMNRTPVGR